MAASAIPGSLYVYILAGLFVLFISFQLCSLGYRNFAIGVGLPKANISTVDDAVMVRVKLPRRVKVDAGDYIGLYIPKIALSQVHPFIVTSWSEEKQDSLDLLIEPQKGFTRKLFQYGKNSPNGTVRMALFSGPHGVSAPVGDYETVLMV
nr:NADPH oxidase family protein [Nostoc sp. EkiNYC01]